MSDTATQLATRVLRSLNASEIAVYRAAVRAGRAEPAAEPEHSCVKASPIHAYVVASRAFQEVINAITAGAGGEQAPHAIHLGQEIMTQRPVRPDEQITIELDVVGARREPRGVRLALRSVLVGGDGDPFAELMTAVLLVGATAPEPFGSIPVRPAPTGTGSGEPVVVTRRITVEMIRRYAEVSGDDNPVHLEAEAARAAGFPGVIAHGMNVMAIVCEEAIDRYAGGDAGRVRGIAGRFSAPVEPDVPIEIAFQPDGTGHAIRFDCRTPQGAVIKSGWIELAHEAKG